jgi:hypothetical protein
MSSEGRHLAVPFLLDHIAAGITTVYPFPGDPPVDLLIEGAVPRLTLRAEYQGPVQAPPNLLKNVRVRAESVAGAPRVAVAIEGPELMLDGQAMLSRIADRIQIDGLEPMRAVTDTLRQWREVLAARSRLSEEAEIGLFGELLIVEALCAVTGPSALTSWRGAIHEEHDFGFSELDVEAKTTSTERRQHWITSVTQLQPTPGRALGLASIQITRGGSTGRTLPTLIETLRSSVDRTALDRNLAAVGWDNEAADLFSDRWLVRAQPALFIVDHTFPAITRALLASAVSDTGAITDVRYRIDLTDRPPDSVPDTAFAQALAAISRERSRP